MPTNVPLPTLRDTSVFEPVVEELGASTRPEEVFASLASQSHAVFFDSAMRHEALGRYSYVAADPIDWFVVPADGSSALEAWRARRSGQVPTLTIAELPPWQGGDAGLIGYEVGRSLERLPRPRWDEFRAPGLAVGCYDVVVAFDHAQQRCWAVSQGLPEVEPAARHDRAQRRLEWLIDRLNQPDRHALSTAERALTAEELAPAYPTPYGGATSDFTREGYLRAVECVLTHLRAGDAYQVNLSQRLLAADAGDPVGLFLRLRDRNPAPFGGYLDGGDWQVASASPERFLRVDRGAVETRPIKGTRPLTGDPPIDRAAGESLTSAEKDRAENVMIVDLLRNDLSRVCEDASIDVPSLFELERFRHVQHLVSTVTGRLRAGKDVFDLLAATLPGGSITGAPKVRAQEIIASLEPTARGAYCGSLAWVGLPDERGDRAMDSSVLIRTLTRSQGWVQAPVGGGIVVQSDPVAEYEETWHKAAGLIDAISK